MLKTFAVILLAPLLILAGGYWSFTKFNFNIDCDAGQVVDSLNGVKVYYNGGINHVSDRTQPPMDTICTGNTNVWSL